MPPPTLARIDELKAELDSLRPLSPERERALWQKLRLEWNYNSNHIEGNTLTYGETYLLLIHGKTNGGHTMREFEEMKAHDLAISLVAEWSADNSRPLTEGDVRNLNRTLLKESFWKEAITPDDQPTRVQILPGEYKRQPNNVRLPNGEIFHFASVQETPSKMAELMEWYANTHDLHPIEKAAIFHHRFVLIHPFGDGNGRTARLVVNSILMRAGYMPLVIKSADKANYLTVLQQADAGDLQPLIQYLIDQELWALELGLRAGKGEDLEEDDDWKKRGELLRRQLEHNEKGVQAARTELQKHILRSLDTLYEPIVSRLDALAQEHHAFFDQVTANIAITQTGGTPTSFGQIFPGGLIKEKSRVRGYFEKDGYQPRIQFSYDLNGFKHGAQLRRWFVVNWFFEEGGMRLEFVPKDAAPIEFAYGVPWEAIDHSFVKQIAAWIQDGIRKAMNK